MASFTLPFNQASPFRIRLLDAPLASRPLMRNQPPGVIQLEGRALPYRGTLRFEGRQRVKTRYYAGNTVATQQIMGPVEEPSIISGVWKDKFLGNGQAAALANLFDLVRRSGSRVEVAWGVAVVPGAGGQGLVTIDSPTPFARQGTLARFVFTPDRPQDIPWEAEFHWSGQGEKVAPLISATGVQNPREGLQAVADKLTAMNDTIGSYVNDPITRIVNVREEVIDGINEVTNQVLITLEFLDRTVAVTTTSASLPRDALERGISVAKSAERSAKSFEDTILDPLFDLTPKNGSGTLVHTHALTYDVKDDPVTLLTLKNQTHDMLKSTILSRETSINTAAELEGQLYPDVIAEVRPPIGTDLRDLALKFYGDPDLWWLIAQYNHIVGSSVPSLPTGPSDNPARPIQIPRRSVGELGDLRKGAC